jgi:hypothetical protein
MMTAFLLLRARQLIAKLQKRLARAEDERDKAQHALKTRLAELEEAKRKLSETEAERAMMPYLYPYPDPVGLVDAPNTVDPYWVPHSPQPCKTVGVPNGHGTGGFTPPAQTADPSPITWISDRVSLNGGDFETRTGVFPARKD